MEHVSMLAPPSPPALLRMFRCAHAHVEPLENTSASLEFKCFGANRDNLDEPTIESKLFLSRFGEYFKDYQGNAFYYQIWIILNVILRALLVKAITNATANANAILGVEIADTIITFLSIPDVDKEAFFDKMWGKVSNLIQIAGIAAYVKKITAVPAVAAAGAAAADAAEAAGEGMDNAGDFLAQQFMILSVLGIFPSMIGALKDAVESITKIYEELQKYKAMVQEKLDAVKAKIDELKETAQYDKVKQFMEDNQKILGWAQKAAIVFGPHIANAAVAKVSSRMDADYQKAVVNQYEMLKQEKQDDEEAPEEKREARPVPMVPILMTSNLVYPGGGPYPMFVASPYGSAPPMLPFGSAPPMQPYGSAPPPMQTPAVFSNQPGFAYRV